MSVVTLTVVTNITLKQIAEQLCEGRNQDDRFPVIHDQIIELSKLLTKEQVKKVIRTLQTGKCK